LWRNPTALGLPASKESEEEKRGGLVDLMDASPSLPARRVTPFSTLRSFATARPAPVAEERCELCSLALAPAHRHLLEVGTRKLVCSCDACALRFESVLEGRFKLIPRDIYSLPGFRMEDAVWEALSLPIGLAFFFHDSTRGKVVAYYPSPAGATESLLPLEAWNALLEENPALGGMEADVEAFLANRVGERRDYYRVPMDICFELVGLIRVHWKGFTGGEEVWREIDAFFHRLEEQARPLRSQEASRA
jgi:hypothetical protein